MTDLIKRLSESCCAGTVCETSELIKGELSKYCDCYIKENENTVIGMLKGKSDYTLMLDAHLDEVSFTVTGIDGNGFLTVDKCGGIDLRFLPATRVVIHGKDKVKGTFCSIPPHLSNKDAKYENISDFKIDTALSSSAKDVISLGDTVTFDTKPQVLTKSRITGKSLDNRVGCSVLLSLAKRLKEKELDINVCFAFTDKEELGLRGAKTASFGIMPDEALVVDVSFATAPDVCENDAGVMGNGAMIGVSPILDSGISNKLISIAKENGIKYQTEVMGGRTGTNADVISVNATGVKSGLISVPIRNMHTPCEVVDMTDIDSVCDLMEKYITEGFKNV